MLGRALLVVGIALLLRGSLLWWPRTVDDAYITFRYAKNLVDGKGPIYNPGERVEGYSSPSFLALSALALAVRIDPVVASKVVGVAASVLLLVVLFAGLLRARVAAWGAGCAALLAGSSMVLQIWSTAGLETNLYALLFLCGLLALGEERTLRASCFLATAALTRPEGLVFWVLGAIVVIVLQRRRGLGAYLLPGIALLVHETFRIAYYGALLPNTYYVKTGGGAEMWRQGLLGLGSFLGSPAHAFWVAAAALGVGAAIFSGERKRAALVLGGAVVLHLLYVVSVGDDGLRVHRFYVPVLGPLAFLVGLLFAPVEGRARRVLPAAGLLAVAIVVPASFFTARGEWSGAVLERQLRYQEGNELLGRFLASERDPKTVIAVASAGAIPYFSGLPTIDMYGLNDAHIARGAFPEAGRGRVMKWDNAYVLSRLPDLIAINSGYCRAGDPRAERAASDPGVLVTSPMDHDLFRRVASDSRYGLRRLLFPDGSSFFVFERAGYTAAP